MIVPQTRLLFWFAFIALPFAALGAVYPAALLFSIVLITGLLALALLDAALAFGRLDGISVELPEVLRASKDRPIVVPVNVHNERRQRLRLRLGLALPRELQAAMEDIQVVLPEGVERSQLEWACQPSKRGNFRVKRAFLETDSRFGFWAVRTSVAVQGEVRVYPNLLAERNKLAALFLHRGTFGLHAQRQIGKGRDFEKLREYVPGDGFDEIHWKATARRGHPVTKVFQIERTQEVYVVIDASRLSARGQSVASSQESVKQGLARTTVTTNHEPLTTDLAKTETVMERFLTSALILGQAAEQQGDLFGLITFTDQVQTFLRAKNGKAHYSACRDAIYTLEPQNITPDFDEISAFIRTRLRRRALLIFLTSLDDPVLAEGFVRNMSLLAGQHLVLVNMIKPSDAVPLFTRPDVEGIDDLYRHLGGHLQWHNLRELEKVLQRRGVRFSLLENERLATELVSQYVGVKRRQLL
jgi:uncharacterized protein (DUF58 family)